MDVNAALQEIRERAALINNGDYEPSDAERLADLIDGLDEWLSKKGFLPDAWQR